MERARERGTTFCPPFDDVAVIAGQGTIGLELVDDIDSLSCVVVPLGGGGLASGVAIAVKSLLPHVRVVGVQAAACAPYCGGAVAEGPVLTLADGIAVKYPGEITGPLVSTWLDEIVSVDEDAIADAMVLLMDRAKLVSEGAGAVGVAALDAGLVRPADDGVTCVVVSGGNVDLGLVPGLIRRRENQAGRRLVDLRSDRRPARGAGPTARRSSPPVVRTSSRSSTCAKDSTSTSARPASTRRSRCGPVSRRSPSWTRRGGRASMFRRARGHRDPCPTADDRRVRC